jgi:hypothetical protein
MKLLTKPECEPKVMEVKIPAHTKTRFNPLGIFGIGSITTTTFVPEKMVASMPGTGRTILKPVEIDFEDEDAINLCIDVGAYDMIKRKTAFTLVFEGEVYILHGVLPEKLLRDNVWECSIDFFEY